MATSLIEAPDLGGAPSKYRLEYCEAIVEHMTNGRGFNSFAASIDVSRTTLANWAQTYPEFADAMARAKARAAAAYEKLALAVAEGKGGPGASAIVTLGLKNFGPDDWQDRQQHEHIGHLRHSALSHEQALVEAARRGIPAALLEE